MNSGTVSWGLLNWQVGMPATSATIITPVADTPLLDGDYLVTDLPQRFTYNGTGTSSWTAVFEQGNYRIDVEGQPHIDSIYFSVPGTGSYDLADIRLSGGNVFVQSGVRQITSNNGSIIISPANGIGAVDLGVTSSGTWPLHVTHINGLDTDPIGGDLTDPDLYLDAGRSTSTEGPAGSVVITSGKTYAGQDGDIVLNPNPSGSQNPGGTIHLNGTVAASGTIGALAFVGDGSGLTGIRSTRVFYSSQIGCYQDADILTGGGHDDTAAIQAVLNQSVSGPIELVIEKTCRVSSLSITNNTQLRGLNGAGLYLTGWDSTSAVCAIICVGISFGGIVHANVKLDNLTLNFNNLVPPPATSGGTYGGILIKDVLSMVISRVSIINPPYDATGFFGGAITASYIGSGVTDLLIKNVSITSTNGGLEAGVVFGQGQSIHVDGITFSGLGNDLLVVYEVASAVIRDVLVLNSSLNPALPSGIINISISPRLDVSGIYCAGNQGKGLYSFNNSMPSWLSINGCPGITNSLTATKQSGSDFTRCGVVTLNGTSTTHSVAFSRAMPTSTYGVALTPEFSSSGTWYVSAKSTTGFTITTWAAPGSSKNMDWQVVAPQ